MRIKYKFYKKITNKKSNEKKENLSQKFKLLLLRKLVKKIKELWNLK